MWVSNHSESHFSPFSFFFFSFLSLSTYLPLSFFLSFVLPLYSRYSSSSSFSLFRIYATTNDDGVCCRSVAPSRGTRQLATRRFVCFTLFLPFFSLSLSLFFPSFPLFRFFFFTLSRFHEHTDHSTLVITSLSRPGRPLENREHELLCAVSEHRPYYYHSLAFTDFPMFLKP